MATFQVIAPESFDFHNPENWPKWIRRFERFRQASDLASKTEEKQVNSLIYTMGDEADDVLSSFGLSDDEKKVYETVKGKFEAYFVKRRNVIFERAKFNRRSQKDGESADSFITALHGLAEHCNFGALREEMIRDRIVVGLTDSALSEKLQMDAELTLLKATAAVREREAIKKQQVLMKKDFQEDSHVDALSNKSGSRGWQQKRAERCNKCGRGYEGQHRCPALYASCHKCHRKGHFQVVCPSTSRVSEVSVGREEDTVAVDTAFLGVVHDGEEGGEQPWMTCVSLNGIPTVFKMDTGADVSVIPLSMFRSFKGTTLLSAPDRQLCGPGRTVLSVAGRFQAVLRHDNRTTEETIYVLDQLQTPLLGRRAIMNLHLAQRLDSIEEKSTTMVDPAREFPSLFRGLGKLEGEYVIKLKEGATPYALSTSRRVAIPLMPRVKKELERMEKLGVISPVTEPTDWCAGMVVVPKAMDQVRICVDLTKLNENVCRERHVLPSVEQTLGQLGGAKYFSKLDANSGFWQIPLDYGSSLLTTFITPYGRFRFNRLPFGITSAPEHFQQRMSSILSGLSGVVCQTDDVLVHGKSQAEHDQRLRNTLERLEKAGLTLNKAKCKISQTRVKFLGQVIDSSGVSPDPEKIRAIQEFKRPSDVSELRRFLGIVNQISKFTENLADKTRPLRELLSKHNLWCWESAQENAFREVKLVLSSTPSLALYDPNRSTELAADASSYGIGAVLSQQQPGGEYRPVAYISRALSPTEQRYAQIEKEALALTWGCERLSDYLVGLHFHMVTDHKPLIPILSTKSLESLPMRVQRFRLRLMRYSFTISHIPGKELVVADALSRAPCSSPTEEEDQFQQEVEAFVDLVIHTLPATEQRLTQIRLKQKEDVTCRKLMEFCKSGWPTRSNCPAALKPYETVSSELSVKDGLLMRGNRIIIPSELQQEILQRLHEGHQGITKCRLRARESVWWLNLSKQLEDQIRKCPTCCKEQLQRMEPLRPTEIPNRPWRKVATDLFQWKGATYLLIVDYFSRYIEIARLTNESAGEIVRHTKSIFARHGIPEVVISDNGPQFTSALFKDFASKYEFVHLTSSPYHPQGNGEAERAVRTVKCLLKKSDDPYLALLTHRSTPLASIGYSPAELLMSRVLRSTVPLYPKCLQPKVPRLSVVFNRDRQQKEKQKNNFDRRHGARPLKTLQPDDPIWIVDRQEAGHVVRREGDRSYHLQSQDGVSYQRNRRHILPMPEPDANQESDDTVDTEMRTEDGQEPLLQTTTRRSERVSRPPVRYNPSWTGLVL